MIRAVSGKIMRATGSVLHAGCRVEDKRSGMMYSGMIF